MSNSKNVNTPVSNSQLKKAETASKKRFNYTWWTQTLSAILGYKPSLADRAFTITLDIADLVRDAITEFYNKIYDIFHDVADNVYRAAKTLASMISTFLSRFKTHFFQMCDFMVQACTVTGDKDSATSFSNLSKEKKRKNANTPFPSRPSSPPPRKERFSAQGGDEDFDDDEEIDFILFRLITRAVTFITNFFKLLPALDKNISRLNSMFSLFNNLERFEIVKQGKLLINFIYAWLTGKPFFQEVAKASEFNLLAHKIGTQLDIMEDLRNPTLDSLIALRSDEKELVRVYNFLILSTPAKGNQFTLIMNAIQKRTAKYAGTVQGMLGRIKPVVLALSGPAGVGKSTIQRRLEKDIMSYITHILAGATGPDIQIFAEHASRPSSFSRNCVELTPEYDDGYCNPMFFVLEEYQTLKDNTVNTQWASKMLRYADSGPLLLNFAFGEKGTRYFDSPFIIATGNYHEVGHHVPFKDENAYFRRIEFDMTVRSVNRRKDALYDVEKHTLFTFTKQCISAHRSGYVTNAINTYNKLFSSKPIDMQNSITYSQLVVLMSLAYLDRINPTTKKPDAVDTFPAVLKHFSTLNYETLLDVSRTNSAFSHTDTRSNMYVVPKASNPEPSNERPTKSKTTSFTASKGKEPEIPDNNLTPTPTYDSLTSSSSQSSEDAHISSTSHSTSYESGEEDEEEYPPTTYVAQSHRSSPKRVMPPRAPRALPSIITNFQTFLGNLIVMPSYVYQEKIFVNCRKIILQLTDQFTFPMPKELKHYPRSENIYGLYAKFYFNLIGIRKKYLPMTSASRMEVSQLMKTIRWMVAECTSIANACTAMSVAQLAYEHSAVGSLLVREAYVESMTAIQRSCARAQADYHLAPSLKLERRNVERLRKALTWRRTRAKRNKNRQATQTQRKIAKREAMRSANATARNIGADSRAETQRLNDDNYYYEERDDDFYYDDNWDDLLELQNIHQDQLPIALYQEDDGYARVTSDKRKFVAQLYHEPTPDVDAPTTPGELLRHYAGHFQYVPGFFFGTSTPTHDEVIAQMYINLTTHFHAKVFVSHLFLYRFPRGLKFTLFSEVIRYLDSDKINMSEVHDFCDALYRSKTIYEVLIVCCSVNDLNFDNNVPFNHSIQTAAILEKIFSGSFSTDPEVIAELHEILIKSDITWTDFATIFKYVNTQVVTRNSLTDVDEYLEILSYDTFKIEDDSSYLDYATVLILSVVLGSVVALVCHHYAKNNKTNEVIDKFSEMTEEELNEVSQALDHYIPQSMDNKKPMSKPGKRPNVLQKFQNKFVKEGGHAAGIRDRVMQNCYACLDGNDSNLYGSMIMLGGTIAVMNLHVYNAITKFTLLPYAPKINNNQILTFPKEQATVLRKIEKTDTIILAFPTTMRQHHQLWKHLISKKEYHKGSLSEAAILSFDEMEDLEGAVHPISDLHIRKDEDFPIYSYKGSTPDFTINQRVSYTWRGCRPGACASPVVAVVNGCAKLIAMHAAGNGNHHGLGVPLFLDDFEVYFSKDQAVAQGYYPQRGENICFEDADPILNSYTITSDSIRTPKNTSPANRTSFVPTPFQTFQFLGGAPGRPADLTNQAYIKHLEKEEKTKAVFEVPPVVYEIAEEYKEEICSTFFHTDTEFFKGCRTLTNEEAIYGFENLDPIDFTTANGILCGLMDVEKRDLVDPEHPSVAKVCAYLDESEKLKSEDGYYCYQLNTDSLKDEIRDHERVDQKKTRVFNVTDSLNNIEIKKACGHMVSKMKTTLMLGPAMCGINPTCGLWSLIYQDFLGGNVVFTDVSGFDFTATKWLFIVLSYWLHMCYGHSRFAFDYAMWAFLSCLQGLRFAFTFGRMLNRGNTSGNWITTVMNTMVNDIYHAVVVIYLARKNGVDPKFALRKLKVVLYSDDNISSLDYPWWNTKNVVKAFKKLFNITLTGVDKGVVGETDDTFTIDEAEFLCRRFVNRDGVIYAPLSRDSLLTQLYWVRAPHNASEGFLMKQLQQNVNNVMRELCEYEKSEAIEIVNTIKKFVEEHELPLTVVPFEYSRGSDLKLEYY